jgi:hypothetical protein
MKPMRMLDQAFILVLAVEVWYNANVESLRNGQQRMTNSVGRGEKRCKCGFIV